MSITKMNLDVTYITPHEGDYTPTLTCVTLNPSHEIPCTKRPAIIICPGGGYDYCSEREAEPVAIRFAGYGVQAFVLRYTCYNTPFPTALCEVASAVSYVRTHADEFQVNPEKIFVCGFSAGAHLAGSLGTLWNLPELKEIYKDDTHKPNGQILCYPVITSNDFRHDGSIQNLVKNSTYENVWDLVSLEKQVSPQTVPTFIWHTADDGCVPVQNTILYGLSLSNFKIPYEMHIYPQGSHGLSLCDETTAQGEWHFNPTCSEWFEKAVKWIRNF